MFGRGQAKVEEPETAANEAKDDESEEEDEERAWGVQRYPS